MRRALSFSLAALAVACSGDDPSGLDVPSDGAVDAAPSLTDAAPPDDVGRDERAPEAPDAAPPPADIGSIPYHHGADVGSGVASKEAPGATGDNVFIGYAGYGITQGSAEAWVDELYRKVLLPRGVRSLYAVGGPSTSAYQPEDIGNSKLIASMLPKLTAATKFVLIAGHSSGAFVANELISQLEAGLDPQNLTAGKVVYFDLDGATRGLTAANVARLRKAYFVSADDKANGTRAPNYGDMQAGGASFPSAGGFFAVDASGSGCDAGAVWCVHISLIISTPHNPADATRASDYSDFGGHPIEHRWLDAKALEAGL